MQLRLIEHCSGPTVKTDKQPSGRVGTCDQMESRIHRDTWLCFGHNVKIITWPQTLLFLIPLLPAQ